MLKARCFVIVDDVNEKWQGGETVLHHLYPNIVAVNSESDQLRHLVWSWFRSEAGASLGSQRHEQQSWSGRSDECLESRTFVSLSLQEGSSQ